VFVTMRQEDRDTLLAFEEAVARSPHVVQAQRLFRDPDYLLRVVTADLNAYASLEDEILAALPGVQRLTSTLVMKHVVHDRPRFHCRPLAVPIPSGQPSTRPQCTAASSVP
jgi:DNA-binding Lrp family transcriptional regulator